jgi:hypothetical protein
MKKELVVAVLLVLIVVLGGVLHELQYVTYVQDPTNTCTTKNGVTLSTEVGHDKPFIHPSKKIRRIDESKFIAEVSKLNQCWYKSDTTTY